MENEKIEVEQQEVAEQPKVEEEVQEVVETPEETTEEVSEEPVVEEPTEVVEDKEEPKEDEPVDTEEPKEPVEEVPVEEVPQEPEETIDDVRREIEDLKFNRDELKAVESYKQLMTSANNELEMFNHTIQNALIEGLRHYGIDPNKTLDDLRKENPSQAVMAEQLVIAAQQRQEEKRVELENKVIEAENDLIFKRAEKEIVKYGLSDKQATAAAETFVNIMTQVGINDLDTDLKAKVKLAVAQAKMDIPEDVQKAVEEMDTTVSETPTEKIETVEDSKVEDKVEVPPTPVDKVDISEYSESVAEGKAAGIASVNEDNVLEKMAALPFKERTAFYREHIDLINEVMRKRR